ncbi:MAG: glycosyltransferase [Flavobacteriales bacterium]|nr:glycosyltransferase [Flavobacteriales bacterium]
MADFSIITPVLNQVSHIERCILSVIEQDCDVQYIIVDGGSTDGTIDIIRKYENRISYWKSEPDSGQSDAINKGLSIATGRFFNWLNADDRLNPNALKTVLKVASEETQVVIGKCEHIDAQGNQIAIGSAQIWDSVEATLGNYSMGQPSVFYRTSVVKEFKGLNPNLHYCMDMDLWFRFLTYYNQDEVAITNQVLSKFLVHQDSKSVGFKEEMNAEKYGIYRALFSQFKLPERLTLFIANFPMPKVDPKEYMAILNQDILVANFCWHLLLDAYEKQEIELAQSLLELVMKGNRLSKTEKLKWKARLASAKLLGR